jgi:hypothetical protein
MKYPLELKTTILDSESTIADADGQVIFRMNNAGISEGAYRSSSYKIKSDIMFAPLPVFQLESITGDFVCSVRRNNLLSLFSSWYQILVDNLVVLKIREGKAMGKVFGGIFDGTPLELVAAKVWNPAFIILRDDNTLIMTLDKRKSFVGKHYTINKMVDLNAEEERMALLGLFGLINLERIYRNRFF